MSIQSRLKTYRERAAKLTVEHPSINAGKTWRDFRYERYHGGLPFGTELAGRGAKGERYTDSNETYGELIRDSTDARGNRDNRGWYADNFQDACIRFGVAKIRTARGVLYVAVTWDDSCDGATYHFKDLELVPKAEGRKESWGDEHSHDETIDEVMGWADSCAEHEAESCREEDAKFQAEQRTEQLTEEIESDRESLRKLLHERRRFRSQKSAAPALCSAITEKARRLITEIRSARKRIEDLREDFWEAVAE